ncbi:MAG: RluA family pseudouridine synthase [Candidatus Omnitrophica bacterium]|nr:RluA family pseudouridine synthase [Candidatus Omnitrophota bacterium]
MARTYEFTVGKAEAGLRLDLYLTRHLPTALSRSVIQRVIRSGNISVGGRSAKAHYRVRANDRLIVSFKELPPASSKHPPTAQPLPLEIAYEDSELLVVNKAAGCVTHPAPGHWDGTLVNAILWHLQDCDIPRAGIIHRLDKDTSGLLLVAKTVTAHTSLSRQLKARDIHRHYLAVVEGHVSLNCGTINVPIGRHQIHRKVMAVRHLGGRNAVTHYRVLKRFDPLPIEGGFPCTLLEISLDTGRTHQIRVHMSHLGHPVLADATYGHLPASYWRSLNLERHLLHAYRLTFRHPKTAIPHVLAAPHYRRRRLRRVGALVLCHPSN